MVVWRIIPRVLAVLFLSLITATAAVAASPGAAGWWKLDEGSGAIANDSSGNSDDGTIGTGVSWVSGSFGTALSFDGISGGVEVPDAPPLEPPTEVTVAAWVNHDGSPGQWRYVVAKGATGCISAAYAIYTGAQGGLEFYVSAAHGETYHLSPDAGQSVWNGQWHLVVGTYNGTELQLFVDGVEVGTGTPYTAPLSYDLVNSNNLYIGDYPGCIQHTFDGWIRDVAVWDTAVSPADVAALLPPPSTGTVTTPAGSTDTTSTTPVVRTPVTPTTTTHGVTKPRLRRLRLTPGAFAAAKTRIQAAHQTEKVTYTDTQSARTSFTVWISRSGVIKNKRCVTRAEPTKTSRAARRCTTWVKLGTFTHADRPGANNITLKGWRLGGRYLVAGHYLLQAIPHSAAGTGGVASFAFRVT